MNQNLIIICFFIFAIVITVIGLSYLLKVGLFAKPELDEIKQYPVDANLIYHRLNTFSNTTITGKVIEKSKFDDHDELVLESGRNLTFYDFTWLNNNVLNDVKIGNIVTIVETTIKIKCDYQIIQFDNGTSIKYTGQNLDYEWIEDSFICGKITSQYNNLIEVEK